MCLENQEKLLVELAEETLKRDKVKRLIQFCLNQSDEIVVCQLKLRNGSKKTLKHVQLIKCEETHETHCTRGPLTTVYHMKNDHNIKQKLDGLKDIYGPLCLDEKGEEIVEDPAFYKKGELLCSICSHEKIGRLFLDEGQYKEFHSLRIPHDLFNPPRQLSLEEQLKEYAYQERTSLSITESSLQFIPEDIGKLTHLKKLEIFSHELVCLPKALEKLTELEYLRITGNKVEDLGFDISKLKNLKGLDLSAMPLKVFPSGITELTQLQELYLSGLEVNEIPETLMMLSHLNELVLPEIDVNLYSPSFIDFARRLKPKTVGISLKDVLGEEAWKNIIESGNYIVMGGNKW